MSAENNHPTDYAAMTVRQLQQAYYELSGQPLRSRNKGYLLRKVTNYEPPVAVVEDVPEAESQEEPRMARKGQRRRRDRRLPKAGTVLRREHNGAEHRVTVLQNGFRYKGKEYSSLSKVALTISGTIWNGYLFFNLQPRRRKAA